MAKGDVLNFQHQAARGAYEDAKDQMQSILETINIKGESISQIQSDIEKNKREASEARQEEQVCDFSFFILALCKIFAFGDMDGLFQKCIQEQDALIPLEQAARQKVAELKSIMDSEKSQGSVLKAILKAKETKQIEGIYGRMGDLGAIDGEFFNCYSSSLFSKLFYLSSLFRHSWFWNTLDF